MKYGGIVFCAVLATALAKPEGYYHQQQYQYKTSSSYKNNELEHKDDNEEFYSKHGDLEGKVDPKVNSYSQHTEYTNPKFQGSGSYHGSDLRAAGYDGRLLQQQQQQGLGGFGSSQQRGYESYGSGLSGLTARLQQDLSQQLHSALSQRYSQHASYGGSSSYRSGGGAAYGSHADLQLLEEELKNNLTRQLQDALNKQYGSEIRQGSYSYSTSAGGNSHADYDRQELDTLKQQLQDNLIRQLQQEVRSQQQYSSSNSHYASGGIGYKAPTTYPGSSSSSSSTGGQSSSYGSHQTSSYTISPVQLTDITRQVETDLNSKLDRVLVEQEKKYSAYGAGTGDYETELQYLTDQLKRNLTQQLNDQIATYKRQEYQYSSGTYYPATPTYDTQQLDRLKQQVQDRLVQELREKLRESHSKYSQSYSSSGSSHYVNGQNRYESYPNSGSHLYPSLPQQNSGNSGSSSNYNYGTSSSSSSGYRATPSQTFIITGNVPQELQDVTNDLQTQLTQQLQSALAQQQKVYSYSSSGGSTYQQSPDFRSSLQHLREELNRNLTNKLHGSLSKQNGQSGSYYYTVSGGSSSGLRNYSPSSSSFSSQQVDDIQRQLQNYLNQQLEQGIAQQQSHYSQYKSSSSYNHGAAATGSSSGYTRGGYMADGSGSNRYNKFGSSYGQTSSYSSGMGGATGYGAEDCDELQGDDNFVRDDREQQQSTQQTEDGFDQFRPLRSQKSIDSDLTQQTEDDSLQLGSQSQVEGLHRQTEQNEFGRLRAQQTERVHGFAEQNENRFETVQSAHGSAVQQTEDGFAQLQVGQQQQQSFDRGPSSGTVSQKQVDSGLTQQIDDGFDRLQLGQVEREATQQSEDAFESFRDQQSRIPQKQVSGATQQTEDAFDTFQVGQQIQQQPLEGYERLQFGSQHSTSSARQHHQSPASYGQVDHTIRLQQNVDELTDGLDQQQIEQQNQQFVDDLSAKVNEKKIVSHDSSQESVSSEEQNSNPDSKTTFWQKVGNKFEAVKDKASNWAGKITEAVG